MATNPRADVDAADEDSAAVERCKHANDFIWLLFTIKQTVEFFFNAYVTVVHIHVHVILRPVKNSRYKIIKLLKSYVLWQ